MLEELFARLAPRSGEEIANEPAEIAARDDAVDTALAANARNAAIAAREALKRTDEEVFPLINNGGIRSRSTRAQKNLGETNRFSDDEDERLVRWPKNRNRSTTRLGAAVAERTDDRLADHALARGLGARAYAELVTEVDQTRARAREKAESALDQSARSATRADGRANANVDACDWETARARRGGESGETRAFERRSARPSRRGGGRGADVARWAGGCALAKRFRKRRRRRRRPERRGTRARRTTGKRL